MSARLRPLRQPLDLLGRALLPAICPGCGARAEPICAPCAARLRPAGPQPAPPPLAELRVAYRYEGAVRELVASVKYRGARHAIGWLADAMVTALGEHGAQEHDAVVWAPTTTARRLERGFDHAAVLARAVAQRCDVPVCAVLARMSGSTQTGRSRHARRRGPRFAVVGPPERVRARRLLLVDDVVTTGATLGAAASALVAAGAAPPTGLAAARTPAPG